MKKAPDRANDQEAFEQLEMFEREFNAMYPGPESQAGIALSTFLKGKRLRQSEWLHISWRLAAAVKELNNLGWCVQSVRIHVEGRKRPIAEYFLPTWVLRAVGGSA